MRACVIRRANDLQVEDRPDPSPGPREVTVAVALGGICGSDLHYLHEGAVGSFQLREPLVPGHEIVGRVRSLGDGVLGPAPGTAVAVHPATPCGTCRECREGRPNLCPSVRYLGSAAHYPHVQGGLVEELVVRADQVRVVPEGLELERAVLAEPLSVALHAARRAGELAGRRVLVAGAGPIGLLLVALALRAGASRVVASDLVDAALERAARLGASATVRADRPGAGGWPAEVDVAFEASGTEGGLASCLELARPRGTVVMVGLPPATGLGFPGGLVVTRELTLTGAFRIDGELEEALSLLAGGLAVEGVVSHVFPLAEARAAFELAGDRSAASKVLLRLEK